MAHDAKNRELKIGDRVHLVGKITGLGAGAGYENCTVELEHPMPPENTPTTISAINTRQVERAEAADREQNHADATEKEKADAERAQRTTKDAHGAAVAAPKLDKYGNPVKE